MLSIMEDQARIKGLDAFLCNYPYKKDGLSIVNVISMDQQSQSGIRFEAFIKRINLVNKRHKIKKIVLILTDFLYRHYLALDIDLNLSEINILANKKGKSWMKKNGERLIFLLDESIEFKILRWEALFVRDDFSHSLAVVKNLYHQNNEFKLIVDGLSQKYAEKFICRTVDFKNSVEITSCFNAAKNYLLEESAIWGSLLNLDFDFITYPGRKNEAIEYTYNIFESEIGPLKWLRYSFEKKTISVSENQTKKSKNITSLSDASFFISKTQTNIGNSKEEKYYQERKYSV